MITNESAFEANIEAHLLDHGWSALSPASYDRTQGLFPDEIITFVQESQPKAWQQLVTRSGRGRERGPQSSLELPARYAELLGDEFERFAGPEQVEGVDQACTTTGEHRLAKSTIRVDIQLGILVADQG